MNGGVQQRIVMEFLEWLESSGFRIEELGTRPPRQLSAKEALARYIEHRRAERFKG